MVGIKTFAGERLDWSHPIGLGDATAAILDPPRVSTGR